MIVLASTSPYRRALLDALGLDYLAVKPDYVEDHTLPLTPPELVAELARGKARSVAARQPGALIIGSDQAVAFAGRILGKPGTAERAVAQLLELAGQTHELLTAVCVHDARTGREHEALIRHQMRMRPLDRALATQYVARDRPLDCAGAYKVEACGSALFESMEGPDHTAIVGLPITALSRLLAEAGVDLLARALDNGARRADDHGA